MNARKSSLTSKRKRIEKTLRLQDEITQARENVDRRLEGLRFSGLTPGSEPDGNPDDENDEEYFPVQTPALKISWIT